ncbi:unnamed protein product, partial [Closterium sp. NIES-54]
MRRAAAPHRSRSHPSLSRLCASSVRCGRNGHRRAMNPTLVDRDDAQRQYLEQRVVQAAMVEVYSEESAEGGHAGHNA